MKTIPARTILIGLTIFLVFAAFGGSLWHDFAPIDDDLLVTHNLAIRGMTIGNLRTVFTTYDPELYIPLTFVSFQMNYLIAELSPWIYHLTNLLLHAINALLVMWVIFLFTRICRGKVCLAPTVFAGLLFAVHPLHTEAVVWIAGRKDLLSTMFFLGAWIAYMKYREERAPHRGAPTYALGVVLFALALFSKVMAVTLPAVLMITDFWIEKRKWSWSMVIDKLPHLALSGIFLVIAGAGKERVLSHHSLYETALMAGKSTVFYLQKFLAPTGLTPFYPYHGNISLLLPTFLVPVLLVIAMIALALMLRHRAPWITFGIAFFLVTLAPTFFNFHKGGEMYFAVDRYAYVPSIGLLMMILGLATMAGKHKIAPPDTWARIGSIAIITILTILSFYQTKTWASAEGLFTRALRLYPRGIATRVTVASMQRQVGHYEQAIKTLREGLGYGDSLFLRMGLGTVYAKMGRVEDAADQFGQAQALDPLNPEPLVALGVLDEYNKKIVDAMEKYRRAIEMDPSYVSARNKLGVLLLEQGKIAEAEEQLRAALHWNPNAEGVLHNLALLLESQGKTDEANLLREKAQKLQTSE